MALTDVKVKTAKPKEKPYKLADGGGMYLLINANGSKYWRMKYRFAGKEKMLSIGVYPDISLADAREKRNEARKILANGGDPGETKKGEKNSAANEFEEHFRGRCSRVASDESRSLVITLS